MPFVGLLKVFIHRGLNRDMNVLNSIPYIAASVDVLM
jgi:hypothetical protein